MLKQLFKQECLCVLLFFISTPLFADDTWPQWRGPDRTGISTTSVPDQWPDQLTKVWQINVGEGHSGSLVANKKVFVFTRQNDREVATCFDLKTGKPIWQQSNDAPYKMNSAARGHGKGPKSTPVLFGEKLYTLGISGILSCFEANSGELKWRKDFSKQFTGALPLYGTAMSPLIANGLLIAHIGGHDNGSLKAFDAKTGEIKWSWSDDGPAYTSPIIATFDGIEQIVTQTQNKCISLALKTGELLWQLPYTTAWEQNIVTPVVFGDTVIFSGLKKGTEAYRPKHSDTGWTIERIWHNEDESMYMSSPVLTDALLFGFAHTQKGHFFCLNAQNGKRLWQSEGRQSDQAAIISAGNVLLCQNSEGELIVIRKNLERFDPIAQYQVANSPTWAPPTLIDGHLLVKDASHLTLWRLQ